MRTFLAALAVVLTGVDSSVADDHWFQFRGPQGNGHSQATGLPVTWSETENVTWKTPIHGRGWSSPVIWGNQIWLQTATEDGKEMFAICAELTTGRILHDVKIFETPEPMYCHPLNSYASPTPVIEAGRVYVHFGSYGTACLDAETAAVVWSRRDLPCDHWRGPGSSPILYEDLLIVHYDGYDFQYVVAFDKATGKTVWKVDRNVNYGTTNGDVMKAYCTPIIIEVNGQKQLISPTSKAVLAYEPRTGKEIWRARYNQFSSTARPLWDGERLYINTGFGKAEMYAIRPDGNGDVTGTHVAWIQKKGIPSMPSQLLIDGLLYMVHDEGVGTCLDAKTGQVVWQERVGGKHSASPIYADGRMYVFSQEGDTTVLAPGREYKVLAVNRLDDGFMASPAVAGKALILRTKSHLYRIEK